MADEIILKYKLDTSELESDYKAILATDANVKKQIESNPIKFSGVDELKAALKLIAKESKDINFKNASNDIDALVTDSTKLKALIEALSKSMASMKQGTNEFKAMDSIIQSANKQLTTLGKTAQTTGTTLRQQNKQAIEDVQRLIDKYGEFDKKTIAAAKAAANVSDKIGDAKVLIDAFNPDTKFQGVANAMSGIAAGFGAVQGAMALVGGESEDMEKALVKVQTAMSLAMSISQLQQAGGAFTALKAQAIATFQAIRAGIGLTGIGAFALAIGAIVTYWDDIKLAVTGVNGEMLNTKKTALEKLDVLKEDRSTLDDSEEILKLQGKSEREILEIRLQKLTQNTELQRAEINRIFEVEKAEILSSQRIREFAIKNLGTLGAMITGGVNKTKENNDKIKKLEEDKTKALTVLENQLAGVKNGIADIDKKNADDVAKKKLDALAAEQALIKQIQGENKTYFDDLAKYGVNRIETADDYYKKEQELSDRRDQSESSRNEYNRKKAQERADEVIKNAKLLFKTTTEIDKEKQAEEARIAKEKEDKLKAQIDLISGFAKNGILLELGINPASIDRIKQSVEGAFEAFKTGSKATSEDKAKAAADVLGNTYSAVSDAIRESDRRESARKMDELNAQQEEELRLAGENEQKKDVIRQKYEIKKRELRRKEAQADKDKAIFDAVIATAVAVVRALPNVFLSILAGTLGAAQVALIASRPLPKFAKGGRVKDGLIQGRPHSAGGVVLEAEGDEFIVNKNSTAKHLGLIDAINSDKAEDYLNRHIVMPAIQKKESEMEQRVAAIQLNHENNIINKAMAKTLNEIKRGNDANTDKIVMAVSNKNYGL